MSTEVPLSRQRGPEETPSPVMTTGTGRDKRNISQSTHSYLYLLTASIPGGETNTASTFCVPAGLVSTAVYVPVLAEVAVMVRVKLKEVVPAGEEQGLLRV